MKYLIFLLPVLILSLLSIFFCLFFTKYIKLLSEHKALCSFLKNISHAINSARYGNLYTKIDEDKKNKITCEISKNLNSLFESIIDRDIMIKEYVEKEKEDSILKEEFIATLTHDLKVPITAQDNTYNLLLKEKFGPLSDIQKEAVEKLKISNIDLKYLVEALLETYKMEHNGINIKKEEVLINTFINAVTSQLSSIFEIHNKKINLKTSLNDDFIANIDTFLVKRVLNNLILNALNYSRTTDTIDIEAFGSKEEFSISVKDYGIGIEKEEIDKIFNKYYSGKFNLIRSSSGLGLYLSNKIIEAHGGKIEVESKKGEGSKFTVVLPVD